MPINKGIFLLTIFVGIFFCNIFIAHESELGVDCCWDKYIPEPAPTEEQFANSFPKALNKVWYKGNGSCMPYARYRSGLPIYGAASTILYRLDKSLGTSTQPEIGAVLVSTDGGGHVSVVESISENEIGITEQNYNGRYVISNRTIPKDSLSIISYIIEK